jgi:branched-chain amino acid transport system substrate-binding protein
MAGLQNMTARRFACVCVALFALALLGRGPVVEAQTGPPLKVGMILPLTGVFAAPAKYMEDGIDLYLKQHGNMLGGRKVDLIVVDDTGQPAVSVTQARKLVEENHVDVLFGVLSAASGAALVPYINEHKIATVYPIVSSNDLTQRTPSPYIVRTGWTSSQPTHVLADYAYKTLGYRKVATIAYDFSFGWESIGGFVDTFQQDGGKVVKEIWNPIVTSDYSPYLSALPRDVDAVVCSYSGSAAINFIRQYKAFGLKMPLICQGNTTDESTLDATGPAATGIITALHYSAVLDTPANKAFVRAYEAAYGHVPSYYAEGAYVGAEFLDRGLTTMHGDTSDGAALAKAIRAVSIPDAPRGPIKMDSYGNPIENEYIRRVEDRSGHLENVVIRTEKNVSQFWTYDPKLYLSKPVYSRTYPRCNACT